MPETISSRTPEGRPNRCPVCGESVCIEPSLPLGDAPCPQCGTLLWFCDSPEGVHCYEASLIESIRNLLARIFGASRVPPADSPEFLEASLGSDSLDVVELVMELEDEFGIVVSPEEAARIRTIADAAELIERLTKQADDRKSEPSDDSAST
ncbi:MAG TPA: acyl carrier protein [Pirellulales bacterium]|nr:acyl carrier protein [Pirellulales bacterium]